MSSVIWWPTNVTKLVTWIENVLTLKMTSCTCPPENWRVADIAGWPGVVVLTEAEIGLPGRKVAPVVEIDTEPLKLTAWPNTTSKSATLKVRSLNVRMLPSESGPCLVIFACPIVKPLSQIVSPGMVI